mmetsp:Transcript_72537/g.226170  ORF Transcript_72537/g.226170 Transcript_72537/m.226170 type:complete len:441 (-) Transcript_72537:182-1504(-)
MRTNSSLSASSPVAAMPTVAPPLPRPCCCCCCCCGPAPEAAARFSASTHALQLWRSTTLAARIASRSRSARLRARVRARHLEPARTKRSITCNRTAKVSLAFSSHWGLAAGLKLVGTPACPWPSTDSTRAMSLWIKLSLTRECLCLRSVSASSISAVTRRSSPRAMSLLSSFSLSCFMISLKSISKRSSRPRWPASSSSAPASPARRLSSSAASRWSLTKETRSLRGNFPAVWLRTKFVACLSMREVGTLTPSIVRSCSPVGKTGGLASAGPRLLFSCNVRIRSALLSCWRCLSTADSSDRAFWSSSVLAMSGAEDPTMEMGTGSKSNWAMLSCSSARAVLCLVGRNVMVTLADPSGGITPASGETLKSGCPSITVISYSNGSGILHAKGTTFVREVPIATRPKSMILGTEMSFAAGYACSGTTILSPMSPQKILTVSKW